MPAIARPVFWNSRVLPGAHRLSKLAPPMGEGFDLDAHLYFSVLSVEDHPAFLSARNRISQAEPEEVRQASRRHGPDGPEVNAGP